MTETGMAPPLVTLGDLQAAQRVLEGVAVRTPLLWPGLMELLADVPAVT